MSKDIQPIAGDPRVPTQEMIDDWEPFRRVFREEVEACLYKVLKPESFGYSASPISGKQGGHDDSETAKHRHLVTQYCDGNGVDLGSSGVPVVPHAIQVDLPAEQYHFYNQDRPPAAIHWRGSACDLPFKDGTLDFVHAAHLLEDFEEWGLMADPLFEWDRVLKPGGCLIIAVPDHERFRAYVKRHADQGIDVDNKSHRHEARPHELAELLGRTYETLFDGFVNDDPLEYSWLWVGRKN